MKASKYSLLDSGLVIFMLTIFSYVFSYVREWMFADEFHFSSSLISISKEMIINNFLILSIFFIIGILIKHYVEKHEKIFTILCAAFAFTPFFLLAQFISGSLIIEVVAIVTLSLLSLLWLLAFDIIKMCINNNIPVQKVPLSKFAKIIALVLAMVYMLFASVFLMHIDTKSFYKLSNESNCYFIIRIYDDNLILKDCGDTYRQVSENPNYYIKTTTDIGNYTISRTKIYNDALKLSIKPSPTPEPILEQEDLNCKENWLERWSAWFCCW